MKIFTLLTCGVMGALFGVSIAEGLPELVVIGFVIITSAQALMRSRVEDDRFSSDEMMLSLAYKSGYRVAMIMSVVGAFAGVVLLALCSDGHEGYSPHRCSLGR